MVQTLEALRERKVRKEDLQQRKYVNQRMLIDDARRLVDKKSEKLKSIAEIAALIGGFAMVVLVETSIEEEADSTLLFLFGLFTGLVVCLMFLSLIISALMLVTILNFDAAQSVIDQTLSFSLFWATRCESDFQFAFTCFKSAIPCFMVSLCTLSWIKFKSTPAVSITVSIISFILLLVWFCRALPQWGSGDGYDIGKDIYQTEADDDIIDNNNDIENGIKIDDLKDIEADIYNPTLSNSNLNEDIKKDE